jgi:nucleotide-binding universal stress UspA family protein
MLARSLVIATDLSEAAIRAARLASRLAEPRARTRAVLVLPFPDTPLLATSDARRRMEAAAAAARAKAVASVEDWALQTGVPNVEATVRQGLVPLELEREATERSADLLAIGTTGMSRLERLIIGSNARAILRHAPCDVLVARGPLDAAPRFRRVVVATDFHAAARAAGQRAAEIAEREGADLIAFHAIDPSAWSGVMYGDASGPGLEKRSVEAIVMDLMMRYNTEVLGGKARLAVDHERAAHGVIEHARSLGADLIVVGSHGAGPLERAMIGSVAEGVAAKAACSVLVVKG